MIISRPDITGEAVIVPKDSWLYFGEDKQINIPKYAAMLGYEDLIEPQIAMMNAYLSPKYRFITACLSRRTGKTIGANIIANIVALFPNTTILVICPDYSLANISWDLQVKFFQKVGIKIVKANQRDRELVTEHGSMIKLASAERADSAVGRSYDLILFDEAALHANGKEVFDIALRPTLDKVNSKCIFISTPRGDNYFKEFYERGFKEEFKNWISLHSTWRDNPRAVEEDILEAKQAMSEAKFMQEYEAKFTTFEGQAYPDFDEENEYEVLDDLFQEGEIELIDIIYGVDVGFRDPTACVVLQLFRKNGLLYAAADMAWEIRGQSTAQIANQLKETMNDYPVECVYIDSAAAQTKYDLAEIYDISCINAEKTILEGVSFVNVLVQQKRLLINKNNCQGLITAVRNTTWDPKSQKERLVHNKFIHYNDALRYALYSHRHEFS